MVGETWTVEKGGPAMLNGGPIHASKRDTFEQSILFVGCGKDEAALRTGIERFHRASLRARKMRMMGSAALGMAYIACGRLDAYIESRISLWDIAAGQLLVETAGGKVELTAVAGHADAWSIVASNGRIPLRKFSDGNRVIFINSSTSHDRHRLRRPPLCGKPPARSRRRDHPPQPRT